MGFTGNTFDTLPAHQAGAGNINHQKHSTEQEVTLLLDSTREILLAGLHACVEEEGCATTTARAGAGPRWRCGGHVSFVWRRRQSLWFLFLRPITEPRHT